MWSLDKSQFSQPIFFFQAIETCSLIKPCWIFIPVNKLPSHCLSWMSLLQFPGCFSHWDPSHASVTVFIILKTERMCFCWSRPILFSLYWTLKCAVWVRADGWGRKATDLIFPFNFQIFHCLPAFVFSLNSASKYVPSLSLEVILFIAFTRNICLWWFLDMCLGSKLFCSMLSYHVCAFTYSYFFLYCGAFQAYFFKLSLLRYCFTLGCHNSVFF